MQAESTTKRRVFNRAVDGATNNLAKKRKPNRTNLSEKVSAFFKDKGKRQNSEQLNKDVIDCYTACIEEQAWPHEKYPCRRLDHDSAAVYLPVCASGVRAESVF